MPLRMPPEDMLRLVADSLPDLISYIDAEQRYRYNNRAYEVWFGRPLADWHGRHMREALGEVAYGAIRPYVERTLAGETVRFETEAPYRDGGARHIAATYVPHTEADGAVVGFAVHVADVTARRAVEAALRESEARQRLATEAAEVGMWFWTLADDHLVWNAVCFRIFGLPETTPLSFARFLECLLPEDRDPTRAAVRAALRDRTEYRTAFRIRRPDGEVRWISAIGRALYDPTSGEPIRLSGVVIDVTVQNEVERALRQSEERLRLLSEASGALAASLDLDVTLSAVARLLVPRFADWCAIDLLEPDGRFRRLALVHADPAKADLARALHPYPPYLGTPAAVQALLRGGEPALETDVEPEAWAAWGENDAHRRLLAATGIRSTLTVPLLARGRMLGAILLAAAESGRRYRADDLPLVQELARRAALALDNARLYEEAQSAVRIRDAFLARASHELRTPLTSVLGSMRWLPRVLPAGLPPQAATLLDIVGRNLKLMEALVSDLLDAAKLASGSEELALARVEAAGLARASAEVVAPQARDRRVAIEVEVAEPLALWVDPLRVEQLLVNLLANAVKFTPPGGSVRLSVTRRDEGAVLTVRDTGQGIAADQLERIFEPFYQVGGGVETDRRARRSGGVGLGLAICRQIAALHGGTIQAESEGEGRGSTFTVRLPGAAAPMRAA